MDKWLTELTLQYCIYCNFTQVFQNLFTVPLQPPITNSLSWKLVLRPAWCIHSLLLLVIVQSGDIKAHRASTALCWKSLLGKTVATFSQFFLRHRCTLFFLLSASFTISRVLFYCGFFSCCFFPRRAAKMSKRFLSLCTVIPAHTGSEIRAAALKHCRPSSCL